MPRTTIRFTRADLESVGERAARRVRRRFSSTRCTATASPRRSSRRSPRSAAVLVFRLSPNDFRKSCGVRWSPLSAAQVAAAAGAELLALRGTEVEAHTALVPASDAAETVAAAVPLAWSAETVDLAATEFVQPVYDSAQARPEVHFDHEGCDAAELEPLALYRRPGVLFAGAACLAAAALTGLLWTSQASTARHRGVGDLHAGRDTTGGGARRGRPAGCAADGHRDGGGECARTAGGPGASAGSGGAARGGFQTVCTATGSAASGSARRSAGTCSEPAPHLSPRRHRSRRPRPSPHRSRNPRRSQSRARAGT